MDGGGVAEAGRLAQVVNRQSDCQLAAGVSHGEPTAAVDVGDGPAAAVLDPVRGRESEASIVRAGEDDVADTGPVSVAQTHFLLGRDVAEAMLAGAAVELSDELVGRSEHDRVESG
jgi:hypothetical protein